MMCKFLYLNSFNISWKKIFKSIVEVLSCVWVFANCNSRNVDRLQQLNFLFCVLLTITVCWWLVLVVGLVGSFWWLVPVAGLGGWSCLVAAAAMVDVCAHWCLHFVGAPVWGFFYCESIYSVCFQMVRAMDDSIGGEPPMKSSMAAFSVDFFAAWPV